MTTRKPSFCAILCQKGFVIALAVTLALFGWACSSTNTPNGSSGGTGGTLPACDLPPPIDERPFNITVGAMGGSSPDDSLGGQGGTEDSGCVAVDEDVFELICSGLAQVSLDANGPTLELADGTTFSWRPGAFDAGALTEQTVVRLEYAQGQYVSCPVCGGTPWSSLLVSDANVPERALVYWTFHQTSDAMSNAASILGVDVEKVATCSLPSSAGCYLDVSTTYFDITMAGSPERRLAAREISQVTTSRGTFDFYPELYAQSGTRDRNCSDGLGLQFGETLVLIRK